MNEIEALELYKNYLLHQKMYSQNTIAAYVEDICLFSSYCAKEDVSLFSCDKILIRNFLENERRRGVSKASLKRRIIALRRYFEFLLNKEIIQINPFINISTPKLDKKLPEFLYEQEIKRLFQSNKTRNSKYVLRDQAIIELLFASGIRVSELCSIKLLDLNLRERNIKINGKGKKQRYVYFAVSVKDTLEKYIKELRSQLILLSTSKHKNYVFLNDQGNPLTTRGVEYILNKIERDLELGFSIHPHKFRHTFATTLMNSGANLRFIQKVLGHENLATTQIYTHVTTSKMKETYLKSFPRSKKDDL